jgi:2-(1,2-epoxy-1,2-dihydrophenyl)acetyl-CoA isomerase
MLQCRPEEACMADDSTHLLFEVRDSVAVLTMNRPERLNALSRPMIDDAIAALERCADDPAVGCIVLTGAGRGFCAGGDVTAMGDVSTTADWTFEQKVDRQRAIHRFAGLLHASAKPTVAAINGACAGAGFGLALACDLRLAADSARFTTAFAKVGFSGDFGISWPLVRIVGEAKAKELLFLSDVLGASEALALGLVNRIAPGAEVLAGALEMAARLARGPRTAYRYMKQNIDAAAVESYQQLLDREAFTQCRTGGTTDHREGVAAFVAKREPRFTGA